MLTSTIFICQICRNFCEEALVRVVTLLVSVLDFQAEIAASWQLSSSLKFIISISFKFVIGLRCVMTFFELLELVTILCSLYSLELIHFQGCYFQIDFFSI